MHQFIQGSNAAFADLAVQARSACVVFSAQEMPAGAEPELARVGFEIDPDCGRATLFVDRGLTYTGSVPAIWEWLATGQKCFRHFADLVAWIRQELALGYGGADNTRQGEEEEASGTAKPSTSTAVWTPRE